MARHSLQREKCRTCGTGTRHKGFRNCYSCIKVKQKADRAERIKREEAKKERKREKKAMKPSKLKKELDRVFSIYIRRRAADSQGNIRCVCCKRLYPWKEAQNMHYISRANMATRWEVKNCYAGCYGCNIAKNGAYPQFTEYLISTYGLDWWKDLLRAGTTIRKWTPEEMKLTIDYYTRQINQL